LRRALIPALITVAALWALGSGLISVGPSDSETLHVVRGGETIQIIAAAYGIDPAQLATINNLANEGSVVVGQTLRVPRRTSPDQAEYVVRPGDTLWVVARDLGVPSATLAEANGITDPNRLIAGRKLRIPRAPSASPEPVAPPTPTLPSLDHPATALLAGHAARHGVDPALALAVAWIDGGGRPRDIGSNGWLGHLQLAEPTFDSMEKDIVRRNLNRGDPSDRAEAGIAYLGSMARWAGGDERGLAAFFQGPGSLQRDGVRSDLEPRIRAILALRERLSIVIRARPPAPAATPTVAARAGPITIQPASVGDSADIDRIVAAVRAAGGPNARVGFAARDLGTGRQFAHAADQTFLGASVLKLPIMIEAFRQADLGLRPWTPAVQNDVEQMIAQSDNDAANRLIDMYGARSINAGAAMLRLDKTYLANPFGSAAEPRMGFNRTSPADMLRLMELLASGQVVNAEASRAMRSLMQRSVDGTKLRAGLPPNVVLQHKSGWFDGVANDVGLVHYGPSTYAIAVFTEGFDPPEVANDAIALAARLIHSAMVQR
jgi:beta-lactamase class A/LysM repeat protein